MVVFDTPEQIRVYRLATLVAGLKLECQGLKMSRVRSSYAILKQEYGFKGNKQKVLELARELLEQQKAELVG